MPETEPNIVAEYYRLGQMVKQLTQRRAVLKKQIQDRYLHFELRDGGRFFNYPLVEGYDIKMEKRKSTKYDELALETLIMERGLWDQCKKEVVNPDLVEQAYIEGKLTDADLRSVYVNSGVTWALQVDKVGEEQDVQADDEGIREGGGAGALHDRAPGEVAEEIGGDGESMGTTEGHS